MNAKQSTELILVDSDAEQLLRLLDAGQRDQNSIMLLEEIKKARIVSRSELPDTVVTMHSTVTIFDIEEKETLTFTLVYPWEANADSAKISILAPVGTALIGYKVDDVIGWKVPGGMTRFRIVSVQQPAQG